jgi:hypothetical protein
MPVVSRFFGVVIAKYGDDEVTVDIHTGEVTGTMSRRALAMVDEWRLLHIDELLEDWQLAAARQSLRRIDPLE